MGVMYDYFSAPSDEVAATALDRIGGPDNPSEDTPPLPPFDTVATRIDSSVVLGMLEALLTGREYRDVTLSKTVRFEDDGERSVAALTDSISAALADASDEQLTAVAVPWSQIEELRGADLDSLTFGLGELAKLARRARSKGERLYCWACI